MTAADKIAEAKGPERIWAHGNCMGRLGRPLPPGPSCHWATWETRVGDPNHATEYVRADLADALAQENAKLRGALRPFSDAAAIKLCGEWQDHQSVSRTDTAFHITFGHLRAARAALGETP